MTDPDVAVSAVDVVRRYGDRTGLDGFTLAVPAGSVFGLVGPNGSGKSTFLALVAAAAVPDSGDLTVLGGPPSRATRARIGTVFQENTTDPAMSPLETLILAGRLYGLGRSASRDRARATLGAVGLRDRMADPVSTLSGGMRRRVELARALVAEPALLLLDEPTTGVDPGERRAFWQAVRDRPATRSVILATNDLAEADAACDHVAFLAAGRVVAEGTPAELKRGLGSETLRVEVDAADEETLQLLGGLEGVLGVTRRAEEIRLATDLAAAVVPPLFATIPGRVRSVAIEPASLEDAYFRALGAPGQAAHGSRP